MSEIIDLTTGNFGYGFSDDYKQGYSDGRASIIEELEKIKAKIEQDAFKDVNGSKYIFVNRVNQIIDNYKAELKGENK